MSIGWTASFRTIKCLPRAHVRLSIARFCSAAEAAAVPGSAGEGVEGEGVIRREWSSQSRRSGAIAVKLGMTQVWSEEGLPTAVTVLQVRGGVAGAGVALGMVLCRC